MTTLTLTRPGTPETGHEEYDLEISWIVERRWPVITCVWHGEQIMALTDAEIADLEERIYWMYEEEFYGL